MKVYLKGIPPQDMGASYLSIRAPAQRQQREEKGCEPRKGELMITNSNPPYFDKMLGRGFQKEVSMEPPQYNGGLLNTQGWRVT
jgi:hypothetical protein